MKRYYLDKLPKEIQDVIYLAAGVAAHNNMAVYLVGGFVRDLILGVRNLDLDILVEGDGIRFAGDLAVALKAKITRHKRFETATVVARSSLKIDIATSRKELYPQPAALPQVTLGTLKDDLARRDFTINTMAISINKEDLGRFIDFFGGLDDLRHRRIRILHDLSFIDDPTRILRAIRFEKRLNFVIEPKTLVCLKDAAKLEMLNKVQPQRLRDEIILILKEEYPLKQIKRIQELTGFSFINPRLSLPKKTYNFLGDIEKEINWFKSHYPYSRALDAWLIYFMGIIGDLRAADIKAICKRFSFRKGEERRILSLKKFGRNPVRQLSQGRIKPYKVFRLLEPLSYEAVVILRAKFRDKNIKRHIKDFFSIYNGMRICVSGDDLRRLGVNPGPSYQKIFTKVLGAKLNGEVRTKKEELALVKRLIKRR